MVFCTIIEWYVSKCVPLCSLLSGSALFFGCPKENVQLWKLSMQNEPVLKTVFRRIIVVEMSNQVRKINLNMLCSLGRENIQLSKFPIQNLLSENGISKNHCSDTVKPNLKDNFECSPIDTFIYQKWTSQQLKLSIKLILKKEFGRIIWVKISNLTLNMLYALFYCGR